MRELPGIVAVVLPCRPFFLLFNCRLPHRRMQSLEQQVNSSNPAFHLFKEEKMMNGTAADKMEEEASFGCLEQQS